MCAGMGAFIFMLKRIADYINKNPPLYTGLYKTETRHPEHDLLYPNGRYRPYGISKRNREDNYDDFVIPPVHSLIRVYGINILMGDDIPYRSIPDHMYFAEFLFGLHYDVSDITLSYARMFFEVVDGPPISPTGLTLYAMLPKRSRILLMFAHTEYAMREGAVEGVFFHRANDC